MSLGGNGADRSDTERIGSERLLEHQEVNDATGAERSMVTQMVEALGQRNLGGLHDPL